jgi:hypothetical protein
MQPVVMDPRKLTHCVTREGQVQIAYEVSPGTFSICIAASFKKALAQLSSLYVLPAVPPITERS